MNDMPSPVFRKKIIHPSFILGENIKQMIKMTFAKVSSAAC